MQTERNMMFYQGGATPPFMQPAYGGQPMVGHQPGPHPVPTMPGTPPVTHSPSLLDTRVRTLEKQIQQLEARITKLEGVKKPSTPPTSTPPPATNIDHKWNYPYEPSIQIM